MINSRNIFGDIMAYTEAFEMAVDHAMLYEVGGFWKLTTDAIAGNISTAAQRKACGYTNDPDDRGGETKYGIAENANPDLNIAALDWEGAKRVYYKRYWIQGDCQDMPSRLAVLHFDGCVNHGVGRAARFLQAAVGAIVDGDIGPATLKLVNSLDEIAICNNICERRKKYYRDIVANNPSQAKYLNGWLRRIQEMQEFVTDLSITFA